MSEKYTCKNCGETMIFNVPRMGAAGGFVHAKTFSLFCAGEERHCPTTFEIVQTPVKPDLALRIARALMPQMSVDAKNGNSVAQAGLASLRERVQREIDS